MSEGQAAESPQRRLPDGFTPVALLVLLWVLASLAGLLWRVDALLYDWLLPRAQPDGGTLIVAIDDRSLDQLGRWPWPRARHAQVLERLHAAGVEGVAMNLLFTEPATAPGDDAALAAALRLGTPVVLPVLAVQHEASSRVSERAPLPVLAAAASGLGHAQMAIERDGIVRATWLREGPASAPRPQLALALLQAVGEAPVAGTGALAAEGEGWRREDRFRIRLAGPAGSFPRVSFVDVLEGRVDARELQGRLIVLGVTARGVGDAYATSAAGYDLTMSGTEWTANLLQALTGKGLIREMGPAVSMVPGFVLLALAIGCLYALPPRLSLVAVVLVAAASLGGCLLALHLANWWWPPARTLAGLLILYPLWSWSRLRTAYRFIERELVGLIDLRAGEDGSPPRRRGLGDAVQRQIELARQAARARARLQQERDDLVRFLSHDLKSPASSLLGLATLQRDAARALPAPALAARLEAIGLRMHELLDGFIALTRAESAGPGDFEVFDLRDAAHDANDEVWAAAAGRDVRVELEVDGRPLEVHGSRQLLSRAIANLLGNAVKASPPSGTVWLRCVRRDGRALVAVRDEGPGVPASLKPLLFQRFSRGAQGAPGYLAGAGLGLAFVRTVAARHGGEVALLEDSGAPGASFELVLPLAGWAD